MWQEDSGYSHIGTSWTNANQLHIDDFAGLYVNTAATVSGNVTAPTLTLSTGTIVHGSTTVLNSSRELINIAELAINAAAAGTYKLYCNGASNFNGDSTFSGNVGIGNAALSTIKLYVNSTINSGTAIYGYATAGSGTVYGVLGQANTTAATTQIGVYGAANSASSTDNSVSYTHLTLPTKA